MQDLWNRIEAWLTAHAPSVLDGLNPGATDEEFAAAEGVLGVRFPDDFRASYRIHNGQQPDAPGLTDGGEFLSLARMVSEWGIWKGLLDGGDFEGATGEPEGPIRDDWWNPAWIPITYDGAGNHLCLDMAPAEGGTVGQIIAFWHDEPSRSVTAPSFRSWLAKLADNLETGASVFSEEYNGIVAKEDIATDEE